MARKDLQPTVPASAPGVAARPVNTFVRPASPTEAPVGPSSAEQLAGALKGFSPTLDKLAKHFETEGKEEAQAVAMKKIAGMTLDEANEAVRSGAIAAEHSPWAQAAFEKLYGRRRANETARSIKEAIAKGEIGPDDDIDAIFAERSAQDTDGIDSRFFASGYGAVAAEGRESVNRVLSDIKTEQYIAERDTTILESMRADVDAGKAMGKSTDEIVSSIFEYTQTNKAFFNIPRQQTDAMLLTLAGKYASEGEEELATKLLNTKRAGNTPSLADNPKYALKVAQLQALAEKQGFDKRQVQFQDLRVGIRSRAAQGEMTRADLVEAAVTGAFTDDEIENLRVRNIAAREAEIKRLQGARMDLAKDKVHDAHMQTFKNNVVGGVGALNQDLTTRLSKPDGGFVDVKTSWSQDTQDKAMAEVFAEDPKVQNAPAPELAVRRQLQIAGNSGLIYSPWKNLLGAGYVSGSNLFQADADKDFETPPQLKSAFKLFNIMRATNPAQLEQHLGGNKDANMFYSIANTLMQVRGMDEDTALKTAVSVTREGALTTLSGGRRFATIEQEAAKFDTGAGVSFLGINSTEVKNKGDVMRLIRDTALTTPFLSPDESIANAKSLVEQSHTMINGWVVPTKGRDQEFVGALPEISNKEIAAYVKTADPVQGIDNPDDLVLAPHMGHMGLWVILDMSRGWKPMVDNNGAMVVLRKSELMARHRQALSDATLKKRAEANAEANEGRDMKKDGAVWTRMPWDKATDEVTP
ncbi:MAG: hypothetical protein GEU78_10275 [Actinobacteria bacterium]|nr:hypothetical protein [Actinomycetota bacterium]